MLCSFYPNSDMLQVFLIICKTDPYIAYEVSVLTVSGMDALFAENLPSYVWVETYGGNHRQRQCV